LPQRRKCPPDQLWKVNLACIHQSVFAPYSVELTHFIDGTQRTSRVMEIRWQSEGSGTVPLFVAQIACVALRRVDRRFQYCPDESRFVTLVEAPIKFLIRSGATDVSKAFSTLPKSRFFVWVDTSYSTQQCDAGSGDDLGGDLLKGSYELIPDAEFKQNLSDPNWLCNQSRKWTAKYRDALEQFVFDSTADSYGKVMRGEKAYRFFVRDGTLTAARGKFVKSAIGLSKSFNMMFLDPPKQRRVVQLADYHRTPVFKFERDARGLEPDEVESEEAPRITSPQKHTMLSWYVRIRRRDPAMPYWGLLRVEIHPSLLPSNGSADRWSENDSRIVSALSAAVIAEANPTSHPDARWHNLIYPIRLCESYARSRMIPHDTVKYLFTWGGASHE